MSAQEQAVAGGLQQHSVGGCYPYNVCGLGNGGSTMYYVYDVRTLQRVSRGFDGAAAAWDELDRLLKKPK